MNYISTPECQNLGYNLPYICGMRINRKNVFDRIEDPKVAEYVRGLMDENDRLSDRMLLVTQRRSIEPELRELVSELMAACIEARAKIEPGDESKREFNEFLDRVIEYVGAFKDAYRA